MASQVLSGNGNVSYTNNTGQNVRVVINFMQGTGGSSAWNMSFGGTSINTTLIAIGRNLAAVNGNYGGLINGYGSAGFAPTEIMLAPGQTFSTSSSPQYPLGPYNIVVIPEAG